MSSDAEPTGLYSESARTVSQPAEQHVHDGCPPVGLYRVWLTVRLASIVTAMFWARFNLVGTTPLMGLLDLAGAISIAFLGFDTLARFWNPENYVECYRLRSAENLHRMAEEERTRRG